MSARSVGVARGSLIVWALATFACGDPPVPDASVRPDSGRMDAADVPAVPSDVAMDRPAIDGGCGAGCASGQTCCDGQCVDLQSSPMACGRCGQACPGTTCANGSCTNACRLGFGDCDGNMVNGCEVDLATSTAHCGRCMAACSQINANSVCRAGRCEFAGCLMGFENCNGNLPDGCETAIDSDLRNCGDCSLQCADRPNSTAVCAMGRCGFNCAMGFADCDGTATNGCETNTRTSAEHCGRCGNSCVTDAGVGSCVMGACQTCMPGQRVFTFTGATESFVVPVGCARIQVRAWGAGGGAGGTTSTAVPQGGAGGGGGFVSTALDVMPGEMLAVVVGGGGGGGTQATVPAGPGGFNGGGTGGTLDGGGSNGGSGGGGGGASHVRRGSTLLVVAGGGGGGGGGGYTGTVNNGTPGGTGMGQGGTSGSTVALPGSPGTMGGGGGGGGGSGSVANTGSGLGGQGGASMGSMSAPGAGELPGGTMDPDYVAPAGRGAPAASGSGTVGQPGRIVIRW
ncbi:MAG: hypothetical protein JNK05_40175 [Myxococcales bacterium]|nr:hypothetical protein [Myxococcales bacterium]